MASIPSIEATRRGCWAAATALGSAPAAPAVYRPSIPSSSRPRNRHAHDPPPAGLALQQRGHRYRRLTAPAAQRRSSSAAVETLPHSLGGADAVAEGRVVLFKREGNNNNTNNSAGRPAPWLLGWVRRRAPRSGDFWEVEDEVGVVRIIREPEIALVLPDLSGDSAASALAPVAAEAADRTAIATADGLVELAWEVCDPQAMYSAREMADLLFGTESPGAIAAALSLFSQDRRYFKQVGRQPPAYTVRSPAEVKSMKIAEERAQEAEERAAAVVTAVAEAAALPRARRPDRTQWEAGPHAAAVQNLEDYALGRAAPPGAPPGIGRGPAIALLAAAAAPRTPQGAAELLQAIGYWPAHAHPSLLAEGLDVTFPPAAAAAAAAVLAAPPPDLDAARRTDLRSLLTITIDDASTTEIDDGLSAQTLPDGRIKVFIHVADPTRWVAPGDDLDVEARRRVRTLYLPTGMVPMFPLAMAEGAMSLRGGHECCALTISCVLAPDGGVDMDSARIETSIVVPHRLDYDQVDAILSNNGDTSGISMPPPAGTHDVLAALSRAAAARREHRLAAGAVEITMPESNVRVISDDEEGDDENHGAAKKRASSSSSYPRVAIEAVLAPLDDSPSRLLVSEMMVLAGHVAAHTGAALSVPLPYRGQSAPALPPPDLIAATPPGPCRMALLRGAMTRSITVADAPVPHAGLGLDGYVQITSPIRRYGDLLAHWQLKAALRGEPPPINAAELAATLVEVGARGQAVGKAERDVQSYWIATYFRNEVEKSGGGATWGAMFLGWFKQEAGLARVLLEELGLECLVKVVRPATPGSRFEVRCSSADPMAGSYRLDEVW